MEQNIQRIIEQIKDIEDKMADPNLCEGTASTYTRITGYYRPVEMWNTGKKEEYIQRLEYNIIS
jgi:anaerobic ribonucleoside-triphosphate reductase